MEEKIKQRVIKHGETIKAVFQLPKNTDAIKLCRTLRRYEKKLTDLNTSWCNGDINEEYHTKEETKIINLVNGILNFRSLNIPVFNNTDPRGYALKIKDAYVRDNNLLISRDWGGYGIISPDLSEVE